MPEAPLYIGIDVGTSGARAIAIADDGSTVAEAGFRMADFGANLRDPALWQAVVTAALKSVLHQVDPAQIVAICVDGTSGTMLATDDRGKPYGDGRMYNDTCEDSEILKRIARFAPGDCAALGTTSGLAKALWFQKTFAPEKTIHQADWIAGNLCGAYSSDENNALKTGYDPIAGRWPDWIENTGLNMDLLPDVLPPGTPVAPVSARAAAEFGLTGSVQVVAGTTDGCASFLATGADEVASAVTVLGTSLTLKILSDVPVFHAASGVYSHRIIGLWLVGGSSNTGGNVLLAHFTPDELNTISARIDPGTDSGLLYYPLLRPGERFPVADPNFPPKLTPVPDDRTTFLKGLFEGIANIERNAYHRLAELGAPEVNNVRSIGGGADNDVWTQIRRRYLNVEMKPSLNNQAAFGAAILARYGMREKEG